MTYRLDRSDGTHHITDIKTWQFVLVIITIITMSWGLIAGPCFLWVKSIAYDQASNVVQHEHDFNIASHATLKAESLASDEAMRRERIAQVESINVQLKEINENVRILISQHR